MRRRPPARKKLSIAKHKQLAQLRAEIESGIRALLNEEQRRVDGPTVEQAKADEKQLKKLAGLIKRFALAIPPLKPLPLLMLEMLLKAWQRAVRAFEAKIIALGQKNPQDLPKEFDGLVESLETVLKTEQTLLTNFETLLDLFPLPPDVLVRSFADLIEEFLTQLQGFQFILSRFFTPSSDVFTESFETLLKRCQNLLLSFEFIIKVPKAPNLNYAIKFDLFLRDKFFALLDCFTNLLESIRQKRGLSGELLDSFETLLRRHIDLLGSLEAVLDDLQPGQILPAPPGVNLLANFEDALHGVLPLLRRFGNLLWDRISVIGKKDPELLQSQIDLFRRFGDRITSFDHLCQKLEVGGRYVDSLELLLKVYQDRLYVFGIHLGGTLTGSPGEEVIENYEELLRAQLGRLKKFYGFIDDLPAVGHLQSFEDLLKEMASMIKALIDIISGHLAKRNLPDFIGSVEDLLKRLYARIRDFKFLIKEYFPKDETLRKSFGELVDHFDKRLKELQALKEKLDKVPENLKKSDAKLVEYLQKLLEEKQDLLSRLKFVSSEMVEEFVVSLIDVEKTLSGLGRIVLGRGARTDMREAYQKLRARQQRFAQDARKLFKRVKKPSIFLRDAKENLQWLEQRLRTTAELKNLDE